jgi:hypothetical protein
MENGVLFIKNQTVTAGSPRVPETVSPLKILLLLKFILYLSVKKLSLRLINRNRIMKEIIRIALMAKYRIEQKSRTSGIGRKVICLAGHET